jgi:uncharacterized membrane protein
MVDPAPSSTAGRLLGVVDAISSDGRLDAAAHRLGDLAGKLSPAAHSLLGGDWIGHPLHPPMTDLPIGCWTSSMMLDFLGGARSRSASQWFVGWGVVLAVPTLATGLNAFGGVEDDPSRRIGVVHAVGNGLATAAYVVSWHRRRSGQHWVGVLWGVIGATLATGGAYLGGHLAFGDTRTADSEDGADDE